MTCMNSGMNCGCGTSQKPQPCGMPVKTAGCQCSTPSRPSGSQPCGGQVKPAGCQPCGSPARPSGCQPCGVMGAPSCQPCQPCNPPMRPAGCQSCGSPVRPSGCPCDTMNRPVMSQPYGTAAGTARSMVYDMPMQPAMPMMPAQPMQPAGMMQSKCQLMKQINEASFAMDDVLLFLDTHPNNMEALQYYKTVTAMRKNAMAAYQRQYGPLMVEDVTGNSWSWVTEKWPWEGGC